jgi:hypothetical protein
MSETRNPLPPVVHDDGYPAGAIIVCAESSCFKPIYVLERGIAPGDKCGRAASSFRPIQRRELMALVERPDLDAGYRAALRQWVLSGAADALADAPRPSTGTGMDCPLCGDQFVKSVATEAAQMLDRAGVHAMEWIPPFVGTTHPRLGRTNRWVPYIPPDDELWKRVTVV